MGAVITRIKAKMRKISGLNVGRRGTKLPCCSRAPQDPHSSWGHKSHWKTSSSHNGNAQQGRERHRVLMGLGLGLGWEVPLLCTALPFPATPPAPALAAVPAPSTARLPRPRWHWAFLALLPLGPFRLPPTTGIWEASGSGEGSAAAVPSEGGPGHEAPHPQAALHLHGGLGHLHPPPPLSTPQPIDYEGFCLFMKTYLEADVPEELCQHLFTSFKRKICQASPETQHQSPGVSQHSTLGEAALPPSWAARGAPTLPTGMKVGGWHLQWVASGPAHNPALPHLSPRALCCSREGFLWDAVARALSSAFSEPGSLRVASPCRPVPCASVTGTGASSHPALGCTQSRLCGPGTQLCLPQPFPGGFVARGDIC